MARIAGTGGLPQFDAFNRTRHYVDIFNRGQSTLWLYSQRQRSVDHPEFGQRHRHARTASLGGNRLDSRPQGRAGGTVEIHGADSAPMTVNITSFNPREPSRNTLAGFVETGGCVSIEAEHYTGKSDTAEARWEKIDDFGRTLSAMAIFPPTAASLPPPAIAPCLEYRMYLFDSGALKVQSILAPTLNFVPGRGLRFAISFDDEPPQVVDALARNTLQDWETSVKDSVRKVEWDHAITQPGYHTLKYWMVDPGVVLEKLVVDCGGAKPSYLGLLESYRR